MRNIDLSALNVNDEVPTARGNYVWFPASSPEDGGAAEMAGCTAVIWFHKAAVILSLLSPLSPPHAERHRSFGSPRRRSVRPDSVHLGVNCAGSTQRYTRGNLKLCTHTRQD